MAALTDVSWFVPPSNPPKDRLTFGVELEASVAYLVAGEKDRDPDDLRSVFDICTGDKSLTLWQNNRNNIAETLRSNDIAAEVVPEPGDDNYTRVNPCAWVIASDLAVYDKPPDGGEEWYNYSPVELISPAYYYTQEAIDEIKSITTLMSNTYRCGTTTGLHVHVGNSSKGFPPAIIQKLLGTVWTFEEHLELIHPKVRWDYQMCPILRRGSTLIGTDEYLKQPEQRTKLGGFEWLMAPENNDMTELYEATKPNPDAYPESIRAGVNIKSLSNEKDTKNTVEFRQHAMTLDYVEAENWIKACVGLLEFADTVLEVQLGDFLKAHFDDTTEQLSLEKLFQLLGMPREGKYFAKANGIQNDRRN